VDIGMLIVEEN